MEPRPAGYWQGWPDSKNHKAHPHPRQVRRDAGRGEGDWSRCL